MRGMQCIPIIFFPSDKTFLEKCEVIIAIPNSKDHDVEIKYYVFLGKTKA